MEDLGQAEVPWHPEASETHSQAHPPLMPRSGWVATRQQERPSQPAAVQVAQLGHPVTVLGQPRARWQLLSPSKIPEGVDGVISSHHTLAEQPSQLPAWLPWWLGRVRQPQPLFSLPAPRLGAEKG